MSVKFTIEDFDSIMSELLELKLWTVLLWRKPIPVVASLLLTELIFFMIYQLNLGCIASMIFLLILYNIERFIRGLFLKHMDLHILTEEEVQLEDEVDMIVKKAKEFIAKISEQIRVYVQHPTKNGNLIFYGSVAVILSFLTVIGNFWFCYVIIHVVMTVPGLYYCLFGRDIVLSMLEQKEKME